MSNELRNERIFGGEFCIAMASRDGGFEFFKRPAETAAIADDRSVFLYFSGELTVFRSNWGNGEEIAAPDRAAPDRAALIVPPLIVPPSIVPPLIVPPQIVPPQIVPPSIVPPSIVPPSIVRSPQIVPPQIVPPQIVPPQIVPPLIVPRSCREMPSQPSRPKRHHSAPD